MKIPPATSKFLKTYLSFCDCPIYYRILLYNLFLKIELLTDICFYVGIPSEGDAGNSFPSYLAGWVYSRPRH